VQLTGAAPNPGRLVSGPSLTRTPRYHCYHLTVVREGDRSWGQLIVRNLDEELIRALQSQVLVSRRRRRTLKDVLLDIPSVGGDADFERPREFGQKTMQ
jgi:hypothetical protein